MMKRRSEMNGHAEISKTNIGLVLSLFYLGSGSGIMSRRLGSATCSFLHHNAISVFVLYNIFRVHIIVYFTKNTTSSLSCATVRKVGMKGK